MYGLMLSSQDVFIRKQNFRAVSPFVKQRFLTSYWVMLTWPVLGKAFQQQRLICVWQKIFLLENIFTYNYIELTKQSFAQQL